MRQVPVFLNPLMAPDVDAFGPDWLVTFLCTPGTSHDATSLQKRWQEISSVQLGLFAPPNEDRILNQLVWPLRHAKGSYVVGNYLGTIALSGVVAEMATILAFDILQPRLNEQPVTPKMQEQLWGRTFDRLEQVRRVDVLRVMGWAAPEVTDALSRIRGIRNQHLHVPSVSNEALDARHAREAFRDAVYVVSALIGQEIKDGKLMLSPSMMNYLERLNRVRPSEPTEAPMSQSDDVDSTTGEIRPTAQED